MTYVSGPRGTSVQTKDTLYIGGEWVAPSASNTIEVISPHHRGGHRPGARGRRGRRRPGRRGRPRRRWPGRTRSSAPAERADYIAKLSQAIQARAQEIAEVITAEMGSPSSCRLMGQVFSSTMVLDGWAELARSFPFEELRAGALGPVLVRKEPVGVVGRDHPVERAAVHRASKLGPALAAGCAHDPQAVARDAARRLPAGRGPRRDRAAQGHGVDPARRPRGRRVPRPPPGVDKVGFTGSTAAGRKVGAICGELLKRCTLELGGKSAAIILDDADLAAAIPLLMPTALMNNGQACVAQTRILAPAALRRGGRRPGRRRQAHDRRRPGRSHRRGRPAGGRAPARPGAGLHRQGRQEEGAKLAVGGGRPAGLENGAGTSSPPCSPTSTTR